MAIIWNHNEFVRTARYFLNKDRKDDLVEQIEQDSRNRMMEPVHYGLSAVAVAEQWLDSLDVPLTGDGLNLIVKIPGDTFTRVIPCTENDGKYFRWLTQNGDSVLPVPEEWEIIAIQE